MIVIFRKIFFLVIILSALANYSSARQTTFDNRQICEENKGIWREFGNGCADNCISKFDKYEICTRALTYACDCGRGRCWHEDRCLTVSSYKKIFDKETAEQEKILAKKAQERQERIKQDPALSNYLQNLYVQKDETQNGQNQTGQTNGQNTNKAQPTNTGATNTNVTNPPIAQIANPPATSAPDNSAQIKVPPIFLQQEKEKQQTPPQNSNQAPEAALPPLPVIPLPQ